MSHDLQHVHTTVGLHALDNAVLPLRSGLQYTTLFSNWELKYMSYSILTVGEKSIITQHVQPRCIYAMIDDQQNTAFFTASHAVRKAINLRISTPHLQLMLHIGEHG